MSRIHSAIARFDLDRVRSELDEGVDPNLDEEGYTPLLEAVIHQSNIKFGAQNLETRVAIVAALLADAAGCVRPHVVTTCSDVNSKFVPPVVNSSSKTAHVSLFRPSRALTVECEWCSRPVLRPPGTKVGSPWRRRLRRRESLVTRLTKRL